MPEAELNVVTGAFSYSGKYITRRLLDLGKRVRTLTGHPERPDPFQGKVETAPFYFDRPDALVQSLRGATTLYNTYWVRFSHGHTSFGEAVRNTKTLIAAAREAGVRRLVHVSITQPSLDSSLPYFSGKAELEQVIKAGSMSWAIVRPTVIFGPEDILINNIAWVLRHSPCFAIPGDGRYRLQPVFVEDFADLIVAAGQREDNLLFDAVGPEVFAYGDLVRQVALAIGIRPRLLHVRPELVLLGARFFGWLVRDVILTREEIQGLMANLLISDQPATGHTCLSDWLKANAATVGKQYASELARHYRGSNH
jgi:uncharacterized protein YbjT (DUF2867 family)